ncbi:hypothetical protein GTU73_18030 [Rathayibacter sp. VKM Ac-2804]|uniref:hypothetical protein n=1 Tax=Rathayibacter sp. VKM Ac-2804 TaxID=2609257 RepID=UPI00132ED337|nr:hypothetical protein [Rathayibacter sp. VKM Ac-2804]QHF25704.1 hypothetical protein GTU73_18030 [Rathayibacter sp. VKM Ac-2804]
MFFDESARLEDVPVPPTLDEVARAFPGPLYGFTPQPSLEPWTSGTTSSPSGGRVETESVAIGYTVWLNPDDHDDCANLAELDDELRASLDAPPVRPLPDWMTAITARMRYPWLWEAVRTTVVHEPAPPWHSVESVLVEHVNHVLMNRFRDERVRGGFPGELLGRATEKCVERDVPLLLDGRSIPGLRIDTDAHVLGVGADLGDRVLTAVVDRDRLPLIDLAFATLPSPDE